MSTTSVNRLLAAAASAVALSVLAACSGGAGASATQDTTSLNLGWSAGWTAPQVAVAEENGYWEDAGLDVSTTPFTSGREALEALLGGGVDAAILTEFPLTSAALKDSGVTAVANLSKSEGYRIIGTKSGGISDIESLEGKKIGVTVGTNTNFILDEYLAAHDISAEIVNIGPTDFAAALSKGDIDAGLMFDTYYEPTERTLGDDYIDIEITDSPNGGNMLLVVPDELIIEDPDTVQELVDGTLEASSFIDDNPEEAQKILLGATGGNVDATTIAARWNDYNYSPELGEDLIEQMKREAAWISTDGNAADGTNLPEDDLNARIRAVIDTSFTD